ncbi:hypothetical protein [Paeniglutamicibacter cryotolerans]|uniref:Heme/copper-type cytochrome/quinol oxidase subunit 1 n=1 Tax=Paeniglutamicibacter cryotolerans TaxID=670079 RepID=A0A839QUR4_9MICC|nr:hypothetical protein [Paeniglutamicibacter cryotolerans]MBB2997032.1 heme/copper-type cytochrome/quinol oxidase subunit 1 [Paeniglutamicibacter cryotolerans]
MTNDFSNAGASPRRTRPLAAPVGCGIAAILVVAGVITLALVQPAEDFGWFGYAPLGESGLDQLVGSTFVTGPQITGYLIIGAGLLALAFTLGLVLGRRARR